VQRREKNKKERKKEKKRKKEKIKEGGRNRICAFALRNQRKGAKRVE
jgi:hypothetical protein